MKQQRLKHYVKCCGLSLAMILASLNLATQASSAKLLLYPDVILLSQQGNNSLTPNISAVELFRNAYQNRYTWDEQFPGYTATVEFKQGKENYRGRVRINPDLKVEVTGIADKDARQSVENQVGMIAVHRRRVPFEVAHKNNVFKLVTRDRNGAVEIFQQGDKSEAHYKLLNQQITQVNRVLGPHSVTVDTLDTEATPEGYLATRYRTIFRNPQINQVIGQMESEDTYKKIGGYYVLTHQVIHTSEQGERTTTELNFTDIKPLTGNS
jgi:hypothetical protein